jgi:putative phosphotransacetylase
MKIPIEISARHVHLSQKDLEKLFGRNYKLHPIKKLSQIGEFATKEEVEIINGKEKLKMRILGPVRKQTQIELSLTGAIKLKLKKTPPIKLSGDLKNATKVKIKGPKGTTIANAIVAHRHLHCSPDDAKKLKIKNNQKIKIKTKEKRSLIFDNVIVRVNEKFRLALHLDTDEANAAGIKNKAFGEIVE